MGLLKDCELCKKKVKVDAIDEFVEKLMEEQIFNCMLTDGFRADVVTSHTIDTIAEQLKEKADD